jgi:pimeloyl-ACP methyl ester carboxylesterase
MTELEPTDAIAIDGRRFAWRTVGEGPVLLLLNGYAGSANDWDPTFLAALRRSFRVVCPDHRGIGGSAPGPAGEQLTIDALAQDLIALLDALGIERAPVVGWSMGGFVAQRLTALAPARVSALVLLASDAGGPDAAISTREVWTALTDHSDSPRAQASRIIGLLFPAPLAAEVDREAGELVAAARAQLDHAAIEAQESAIYGWRAAAQPAPGPDAPPVLIAHGSEDVVIPAANAELLAHRWPGAQVELFAGCGHAFMAQEPERLAGLITAFAARPRG